MGAFATRGTGASGAWKAGLFATAASLLFAGAALAQTHPPEAGPDAIAAPVQPIQEIVVTGSQIRGVTATGSPVIALNREDLVKSGATNVVDFLEQTPQIFNVGVSDSSRGNTGGSSNITFGSSINIRGLSPYATLTLIDGHNMVAQEARAETVDPSHIPTNMLQRVEIVADGGSAIYGSQAIAGIANLILRRNFEGVEASVRYGASDVNYNQNLEELTLGHRWSTGQFTAGVEHMFTSDIKQSELSYDTRLQQNLGGTDIRQNACNPGTIQIGATTYAIPAGGVTPANAGALLPGTQNLCEPYKHSDALPQQERTSFAFTLDQDLTSKLHFSLEGYVSKREFVYVTAPYSETVTVPSTNAFFVAPAGVLAPLCSASANATFGTPAGTRCETVLYNFANDNGYAHRSTGFSQVYETTATLKYDLPFRWLATLDYTYGFNTDLNFDRGFDRINAANQNIALASANPATALNVFGGASSASVLSNTSANGVFNQLFDTGGHTIISTPELKIDGPLFRLPGGEIRAAAGTQWYDFLWWSNNKTGPLTAPLETSPQHVHRSIFTGYGELNIPIFGSDFTYPMLQKLDIDLAGRIDTYNDVGTTKNPKLGINYQPFHGLVFHATYGTSFRSPNVLDLYQSSTNINVNTYTDPKAGGASVLGLALSGGNPNIKPETAVTYSFGGDYSPDFIHGLNLSLNYFSIKYSNQIASYLTNTSILTQESALAGTGIITRVTSLSQVQSILAVHTVTSGTLPGDLSLIKLIIDGRPQNIGRAYAEGVDVNATYRLPTPQRFGAFTLGLNGELFTRYEDQATLGSALVNRLNTIFYAPRWRARYFVDWTHGPLAATVTLNYLNPYTNNLVAPTQRVSATTTTDVHLSYQLPKEVWTGFNAASVSLDVDNIFDENPPTVLGQGTGVLGTNATNNYGGAGFDPTKGYILGRLIAVTLKKRF